VECDRPRIVGHIVNFERRPNKSLQPTRPAPHSVMPVAFR
jgi:hypothetical protein